MPSNYYCADNFFKKMTDLDSPRRNNDCYFYYYSTCAKGDSCTFRHEPSALGCETMCSFWKEGKCLNVHCNFRHMELRKNRKAIQCYWETQPGGCLKPHCPFLHQNVKQSLNDYADNNIGPTTETSQTTKQTDIGQTNDKFKTPVDSLVVNFEEESDTESGPSFSPAKSQIRKVKVKTLEEIKLERIQEESAAYFYYHEKDHSTEGEDDLRHRLLVRMRQKRMQQDDAPEENLHKKNKTGLEDALPVSQVTILEGEEMRTILPRGAEEISLDEHILRRRRQKFVPTQRKEEKGVGDIRIKTLAEIRAERMSKQENVEPDSQFNEKSSKRRLCLLESENEVSSTSKDETEIRTVEREQPKKRLKLKRLSSAELNMLKQEQSMVPEDNNCITAKENITVERETIRDCVTDSAEVTHLETSIKLLTSNKNVTETISTNVDDSQNDENVKLCSQLTTDVHNSKEQNASDDISIGSDQSSNKLTEEALLLDDDEDFENVTLKAEDELLEEIDDILGS